MLGLNIMLVMDENCISYGWKLCYGSKLCNGYDVNYVVVDLKDEVKLTGFGSWFPWSIDGDFDGLRVGCHLERHRADLYCEGKRFS